MGETNNNGDDYIELVLATKENTANVGWLINDSDDNVDDTIPIPFYATVQEGANFPEADWKSEPVVRQAKISWRDDNSITWIERHMEMTQGFLLVGKAPGMLVLGEPTHDREDLTEDERKWPDWSRVKGYILPAGCGIIIKKGTWHDFPVSVGPTVAVFIINTKEVVDALTSMEGPGEMDFGDCYKRRVEEYPRYSSGRKIRFPDPRPFVQSLGIKRRRSTWGRWRQSFKSLGCQIGRAEPQASENSNDNDPQQKSFCDQDGGPILGEESSEEEFHRYGRNMTREEVVVQSWGGPNVHVVPVVNVESFAPDAFGPSIQPHLNKTQPELANRGWREYGNKRGLARLGKLFGKHGISCTAVVSSDLVDGGEDVTDLLHEFSGANGGWEVGAHGKNNSNAGHAGLVELDEFISIMDVLNELGKEFYGEDDTPKTWLTPGFSVTNATPKLLAEAGVETLLDFVDDDVPYILMNEEHEESTANDPRRTVKQIVCLPYSMETNDFSLVLTRNLSPREYAATLESHISQLAEESRESGKSTVVCLGMHTFVAGTPASVYELNKVLGRLKSNRNVVWSTAQEVTRMVKSEVAYTPPEGHAGLSTRMERVHIAGNSVDLGDTISIQVDRPYCEVLVDRNNVALIMIDFQVDFMNKEGFGEKLGNDVSKLRRTIEPARSVLASCRKAGLTVIHTREGHRPELSDVSSLKAGDRSTIGSEGKYGRCMVRGQEGNEIIEELAPIEHEPVIDKPGKGAFYMTDLELILKNAKVETLLVCGVTTEVCVHATVREANDRGIQCIVLEDCTASYFDESHRVGVDMICAQGGILGKVTSSLSVLDGLSALRNDVHACG